MVAFDLDGTLLQHSTVSLLLARWTGRSEELEELERRFAAHEISNSVVASDSAAWLAGRRREDAWAELEGASWIAGIPETLAALREAGCELLLATITWRFAAEMLAERHGFAACCGTEMDSPGGVLSGRVARHFDEHDKARFVRDWCSERSIPLSEVAAVGDSRSDVPLFALVGRSIALNATADARAAASVALDSDDLRDVLPLLLGPRG